MRSVMHGSFNSALVVSLIAASRLVGAQEPMARNSADYRLISVSGQGQLSVLPDEVVVAFGVETFDADLNLAKLESDTRVKRLVELAPAFKIKPAGVRIEPVRVQPSYEDRNGRKTLQGYFVRRSVELTLVELTEFERLISAGIEAGANQIQGVNFRTKREDELREEARKLAVRDARTKADTLARELGRRAGGAQLINETGVGSYCSYNSGWGYVSWGGGVAPNRVVVEAAETSLGEHPEISRVEITANVQVNFILE